MDIVEETDKKDGGGGWNQFKETKQRNYLNPVKPNQNQPKIPQKTLLLKCLFALTVL